MRTGNIASNMACFGTLGVKNRPRMRQNGMISGKGPVLGTFPISRFSRLHKLLIMICMQVATHKIHYVNYTTFTAILLGGQGKETGEGEA